MEVKSKSTLIKWTSSHYALRNCPDVWFVRVYSFSDSTGVFSDSTGVFSDSTRIFKYSTAVFPDSIGVYFRKALEYSRIALEYSRIALATLGGTAVTPEWMLILFLCSFQAPCIYHFLFLQEKNKTLSFQTN